MIGCWKIFHHSEFHYYGVAGARQVAPETRGDPLGRTGGFTGECPLCTNNFECAVCAFQKERKAREGSIGVIPSSRRKICGKQHCPQFKPAEPVKEKPLEIEKKKQPKSVNAKKGETKAGKSEPGKECLQSAEDKGRLCGNCGRRGHQAVTCVEPCFACGGNHKYYECDDPDQHHVAKKQANRNRVVWKGWGANSQTSKRKSGMKESGAGKFWVRKEQAS